MKLYLTLYVVVLALALAKSSAVAIIEGAGTKMAGGGQHPLANAPFQVSFQNHGRHFCGGSIIDPNFIVTAGHCCEGLSSSGSLRIVAGLSNLSQPVIETSQNIKVPRTIVHPDYDSAVPSSDICVAELEKPLILSIERRTAMIKLPPAGYTASGLANVTGWGQSYDGMMALVYATVPIVTDYVCRAKYENLQIKIVDEVICAGEMGQDTCFKDNGGPLVDSKGFLVGIGSWGYGCQVGEYPDVFTEVSYFTEWVKVVLANS